MRLGSQSIGLRPEQSTMPRSTGTGMAVVEIGIECKQSLWAHG